MYASEGLEANVKAAVAVMGWRLSGVSCIYREFFKVLCNAHMHL